MEDNATTLQAIADSGAMPDSLEAAGAILRALYRQNKLLVPVTSMLLADARRRWFQGDPRKWVAWAQETTGLEGADIHHRRAIGELLLALREENIYKVLFGLDCMKLLSLTRLPVDQVAAFCSTHKVQAMTRDDLRNAVAAWLGEDVTKAQPMLPGLETWLGYADADVSKIADHITDDRVARRTTQAARNIMTAALVHFVESQDILGLAEARESIQSLLCELEESLRSIQQ